MSFSEKDLYLSSSESRGGIVSQLLPKMARSSSFHKVRERLNQREKRIHLHGLVGSLKAFLITWIKQEMEGPILAIASDDEALRLRDDLETVMGDQKVNYFPPLGIFPSQRRLPQTDPESLRIETLDSLLSKEASIVVTTVKALVFPTIPPEVLELCTEVLRVGEDRDLSLLTEALVDRGFERLPMVEEPGQISLRGGILDVFPFGTEDPYRIEFFGDRVESIRQFDVYSQRSVEEVDKVKILPRRDIILNDKLIEDYIQRIEVVEKEDGICLTELKEKIRQRLFFEGMELCLPIIYESKSTLLDYVGSEAILFLEDQTDIEVEFEEIENEFARIFRHGRRRGEAVLPPGRLHEGYDSLQKRLAGFRCLEGVPFKHLDAVEFGATSIRQFEGDLKLFRGQLSELSEGGYQAFILCENRGQAQRLEELLEPDIGSAVVGVGSLHRGFVFPDVKTAVFNDHEVFSRYRRRYRYHKFKGGVSIPDFTALTKGDFVVHQDHGIGKYIGIERLIIDDKERDCLLLFYRDGDKLYVPVEQLDRVKKYSGQEGVPPVLSKLGGTSWERVKARAKRGILRMAKELIQLYAERKSGEGFAFSPDSEWQRQLEASFIYQDTLDQLIAATEVKKDMERPVAMDRLICGDVGYGKTEVAIRAAFKVMNDGKQVAVLVPTTILAQQHYNTFAERLSDFPVKIEVLSRFQTRKRQEEIVKELEQGKVDIVIGTHRLLSRDVNFKDLGLVIIDDEHRFGVRHKEKLKQLRRLVDVITLTATPIPRTLHMSLMGARDMSVINTPPKDRLPIQTEILPFDEDQIAEAILREVDRDGQVYFVHNRVRSIDSVALFLERLLPQVRFAVAHGQMPEKQLENIMLDFLDRKYDCLVSTMIIESGLDIPNVNTIIIHRADRFGLAQLYQLRGRVGRSNRQAYAYLLVPPHSMLSRVARRRLRAIEEFSELGSGLKLAMRDLEIRGAGNILGPEQHGFIAAVGFDMYCRLLEEAVRELKGEKRERLPEPKVEIRANAFIPESYIPEPTQKISIYQRLADVQKTADVWEISEELRDRYGPIPQEAASLLEIVDIKLLARKLRLDSASTDGQYLMLTFPQERKFSKKEIHSLVKKLSGDLEFSFDGRLAVKLRLQGHNEHQRLSFAKNSLQQML